MRTRVSESALRQQLPGSTNIKKQLQASIKQTQRSNAVSDCISTNGLMLLPPSF
jgi:hypothetical protein